MKNKEILSMKKSEWILPCNINHFDIIAHFKRSDIMIWKGVPATKIDDIVYLYVGRPYSEIKYICKVIACDLDVQVIEKSTFNCLKKETKRKTNIIRIQKIIQIPKGMLCYADLKEHGLASVQSQMRVSEELSKYIRNKYRMRKSNA